jgi:ABC-2 type transport system ATP-binding protein
MSENLIAISVRGLTKSYGKTAVLKGVDFEISKGAIFCLLGSNGAGKTTIVRILTTLIKADGGETALCGRDVRTEAAEVRRLISLTGQSTAVDGLLTARENMIMTARLFHIKESKRIAAELLKKLGLSDVADKKVSTFSGGMRRRLDIAMSLTGNPAVLFLDEPTTGLDPQSRIDMWYTIRGLADTGVTVFLTTQYLDEAEQLADKIAILHEGKIIREGTPEELKAIDNTLMLTIKTNKETDGLVEAINRIEGIDVLSVERKSESLEDVFLRLIHAKEGK